MARILWTLKQLVPCTYWTTYVLVVTEAGDRVDERRFVIWKMWLGRCYDVVDLAV